MSQTHVIKSIVELLNDDIRVVAFEKPLVTGVMGFSKARKAVSEEERKRLDLENLKRSARRSAKKIRALIKSSFNDVQHPPLKMITLTYKSNNTQYEILIDNWRAFINNAQAHGFLDKYLAVVERQERGAFHLHVLTDSPFMLWERLLDIWREAIKEEGGLWISTQDTAQDCTYLSRYLTDEKYLQEIPPGKKRFFHSLNVTDLTIRNCSENDKTQDINRISEILEIPSTTYQIETKERGKITVTELKTGMTSNVGKEDIAANMADAPDINAQAYIKQLLANPKSKISRAF